MSHPIGENIRRLREARSWSLQDLADEAGLSKTYLWQIENNRAKKPSVVIIHDIATALDTTISAILGLPSESDSGVEIEIPESLARFFSRHDLSDEHRLMLARIHLFGQRPSSVEEWEFLWRAIQLACAGEVYA